MLPNTRSLTPAEQNTCWQVFRSTVDYNNVLIADDLGLQGRAWCSPPLWGGLASFCLHVGPQFFGSDMSQTGVGLLIHEMTHVWQGQRNIPLWYVINSGCNQALSVAGSGDSGGAYSVDSESQKQWKDYGAEQQASIVQGWRMNGMSSSDWRYRYIVSNIRAGDPWALSQPVKPPVQFTPFQPGNVASYTNISTDRRLPW